MDWIAQQCGVSKSTVFNIVHAKIGEDHDFGLMRFLVDNLNKRGTDLVRYSSAIRIQMLFEQYGMEIETGETILEKLLFEFYRLHWSPHQAIPALKRFEELAAEYSKSPDDYAVYITGLKENYRIYKDLVNKEKEKYENFLRLNGETRIRYAMISTGGSFSLGIDALQKAKLYEKKYLDLLSELERKEGTSVDKGNLAKLNKAVGFGIEVTEAHIFEKLQEIRLNPEKFWFLFQDSTLAMVSGKDDYPLEIPEPSPPQPENIHN